jgi:hypothetical protein
MRFPSGFFLLKIKQLREYPAELFITEISVNPGTGFLDDLKIFPAFQNAWMQRPLSTAPRFPCMNGTAVIIENTVTVYCLHLNGISGLVPILFNNFMALHIKIFNHSFLVVRIQGNCGFALAAVAALLADEYV